MIVEFANIRLMWEWMKVANTLAYCNTATITTEKSFRVQTPLACTIKLFTTVIYGFS